MKNWRNVILSPQASVRDTIEVIDASAMQIALVVDKNNILVGTVTDGDIRRAILKGIDLGGPVSSVMNSNPTVTRSSESREVVLAIMRSKSIHQIPVVDETGALVGLELLDEILQSSQRENPVVLMAGGLGSRLRPLTNECPKPLLKVGNKPILETILENFIEYGFVKFYISINYKAEMIEKYFGDGSRWGVEISYIRENERLGTAGALSQMAGRFTKPLIIMNGDLLTRVNFSQLLSFHTEHAASATMCVRDYHFQVPYGVVKIDRHNLVDIEEKPVQRFFVSAGIYVVEPDALELIPPDTFFDMPNLFKELLERKKETVVFPIREYWLDIGRLDDFEKANGDFDNIFEP